MKKEIKYYLEDEKGNEQTFTVTQCAEHYDLYGTYDENLVEINISGNYVVVSYDVVDEILDNFQSFIRDLKRQVDNKNNQEE